MEWPDLLPHELKYCTELSSTQGLIQLLLKHSMADLVRFFEAAADDETWTLQNAEFMNDLLEYFTRLYSNLQLQPEYSQRIVEAIQQHYSAIEQVIPKNLIIECGSRTFEGNTFFLSQQSGMIHDLWGKYYKKGYVQKLSFPSIDPEVFDLIINYLCSKKESSIREKPRHVVLETLTLATQWRIPHLAEFCTQVMEQYISLDTVVDYLQQAQSHGLEEFKDACYTMLNNRFFGFRLKNTESNEIEMVIEDYLDESQSLVKDLLRVVRGIGFRKSAAQNVKALEVIKAIPYIHTLDLKETEGIHEDFIKSLPTSLDTLDLTNCEWLDGDLLKKFHSQIQYLRRLILDYNPQVINWNVFFKPWTIQSLSIRANTQIDSVILQVIVSEMHELLELNLQDCTQVDEEFAERIGVTCLTLLSLDLSNCIKLTDNGLRSILLNCSKLQNLNLSGCKSITETGARSCLKIGTFLNQLDVSGCNLSRGWEIPINTQRPNLKIVS